MNRIIKLEADIRHVFATHPNELFTIVEMKRRFKIFTEPEVFMVLRKLYEVGFLNRQIISHRNYYWLRRSE